MMELLSDSTLESFSSETLSPDTSFDISKKSHDDVISSPVSRGERKIVSTSTDCSEQGESKRLSLYSASFQSETLSEFTSAADSSQESASPETAFLRRCHEVLKNSSLGRPSEPKHALSSSSNEPKADFCEKCVKILHSSTELGNKVDPLVDGATPEKAQFINTGIIERLKMENLIHSMREVTSIPDMPSLQHCHICKRMQRDIQERSFVQDRVRHLKNRLTEEKYLKYLSEMDSINQIGNLAVGLPKATDAPEEIWKKLMAR